MTRKSSDPKKQTSRRPKLPKFAGDGLLKREHFTPGFIARLEAHAAKLPGYALITQEERAASRAAWLNRHWTDGPLWVFGYGSLMWNPAIHVAGSERAHLHGYHRAFCLHLVIGRGNTKNPGLMLGLDRGGSCVGIAHRIAAKHVDSETEILWLREMVGDGYRPAAVRIALPGKTVTGLTFVANRTSKRFAGRVPFEKAVRRISRAEGDIGTNRDYLYRTVENMDALGLGDGPLHDLERAVRARAGDTL